jgi:two-component system, NarL family, sensor histidine kinase DesK
MNWRRAGQAITRPVPGPRSQGSERTLQGTGQPAGQASGSSSRVTALVAATLLLLFLARAADADEIAGLREVAFVAPTFIVPMLYAFSGTRLLVHRYRWWLLGAQAALTWVPIVLFGDLWVAGTEGLLAGLVLLTLAAPLSWLVAGGVLVADVVVRWVVTGLPAAEIGFPPTWTALAWLVIGFVDDGLTFFGMVRLAEIAGEVRQARGRFAELAVAGERIESAARVRSAMGDRLDAVAGLAAAARQALATDPDRARARIAEAGVAARQAVAQARTITITRRTAALPLLSSSAGRAVISARLAWAVLVAVLAGFAGFDVAYTIAAHYGVTPAALGIGTTVGAAALQLYLSRPVPGGGRARRWRLALVLQAVLVFAAFLPVIDVYGGSMAGFLAGSILLLVPGRWRWAGFAAAILTWTALFVVIPLGGIPVSVRLDAAEAVYLAVGLAANGLAVYGLSWLAGLARRLEELQGELALTAVVRERLRMARDVHDVLGLGLSAIALKADLIERLIGRDDASAVAEIEALGRICAAARAEVRQVTGDGQRLSLRAELAAARQILGSAGVDVDASMPSELVPSAADAVLAVVLREAVTNVLRHSAATACTICVTEADGILRLHVSNDGVLDEPAAGNLASRDRSGSGLDNLAVRLAAADGRLTSSQASGRFDLVAEIPTRAGASQPVTLPEPASPPVA